MTLKDKPISWDKGDRMESLQNIAKSLADGGMPKEEIDKVIRELARQVNPPPEQRAAVDADRSMAAEVRAFIDDGVGVFCLKNIYDELCIQASDKKRRTAIRVEVKRLKDKGVIEQTGKRHSEYRRVSKELVKMDFVNAPLDDIPLLFPFGLEQIVSILPKDIIIIAGHSGTGKTGFLLNFVRLNMDRYDIHYFTNDMGPTGARRRLEKFGGIGLTDWKFHIYERSSNHHDVIFPDSINVVDYLDQDGGEYFKIPGYISRIWDKLVKGICIIALQKNKESDYGKGGQGTLEKSRLYLAMDFQRIKIVKATVRKNDEFDPVGKIQKFKLYGGWNIEPDGLGWRDQSADEIAAKGTKDAKVTKFKNIG